MDLHASQIQGFFDIPVDNLLGSPIFAHYYHDRFSANRSATVRYLILGKFSRWAGMESSSSSSLMGLCWDPMLFGRNKAPGVSWLVVGLGNLGEEYERTRHNAGFEVVDLLAQSLGVRIQRLKFKALIAAADIGDQKVLLMKPTTYMNLSGEPSNRPGSFRAFGPKRPISSLLN